ncbi:uncharacterized protein LOC127609233 isoform X2 [Hippocampus zosterae]|uniref:uncharacterized protein LOC127609233 isoform X2 n=1 Tax=Hippocampus zosterae TaxID=109293 RepID=UPI00223DB9E9|nr:uncharacterized protein LOC127609233 isoform X2 [Hippocampus zosterae]
MYTVAGYFTHSRQLSTPHCNLCYLLKDVITHNNQPTLAQGILGHDIASCSRAKSPVHDGEMAQWRGSLTANRNGLQQAITAWSSPDYSQEVTSTQPQACRTGPTLTADVYMQTTLCPSYTMLTYTQTPLLTNVGTIPVAATTCSLPQMDLPDLGCAYLPWTHPLTTLSTVISGVQFASGSTPMSGSSLVHTPLSKSLTNKDTDSQHQILEALQYSDQTNPKLHNEVRDEDQEVELETPNLLDKILEDQGKDEDSGGKVSYSNWFYLPSAF